MTWAELLQRVPQLRPVRDAVRKKLSELPGPESRDRQFGQDETGFTTQDLATLLGHLQSLAARRSPPAATERWVRLAVGTEGELAIVYYQSDTGRIEGVRADLHRVFLRGKPLDAALRHDTESGTVIFERNGAVVAQLSDSLVSHLRQERSAEADGSQPAPQKPAQED